MERAQAALAAAHDAAVLLPDAAVLAETAAQARAHLAACRAMQAEAAAKYGEILQAHSAAQIRAPALAQELLAWQGRAEEASRRRFGLATRRATAAQDAAALAEAPDLLAGRAAASGDALTQPPPPPYAMLSRRYAPRARRSATATPRSPPAAKCSRAARAPWKPQPPR
jgi:hypothetical protein